MFLSVPCHLLLSFVLFFVFLLVPPLLFHLFKLVSLKSSVLGHLLFTCHRGILTPSQWLITSRYIFPAWESLTNSRVKYLTPYFTSPSVLKPVFQGSNDVQTGNSNIHFSVFFLLDLSASLISVDQCLYFKIWVLRYLLYYSFVFPFIYLLCLVTSSLFLILPFWLPFDFLSSLNTLGDFSQNLY